MNVHDVERFLEQREIKRNDRISKVLVGSMRPPDTAIIKKLKEEKYGKPDGQVRILRHGDGSDSTDAGRSQ